MQLYIRNKRRGRFEVKKNTKIVPNGPDLRFEVARNTKTAYESCSRMQLHFRGIKNSTSKY